MVLEKNQYIYYNKNKEEKGINTDEIVASKMY
ncbi:hypothetical protein SAMN04488528_100934 [Clostridium frigidicarnis]|uniref:Uncharacterized protein n=1 Tax=Clostridium frigidicarnis TaxID=84698 RepID=A0A1I0XMV8_9CLOT|nr:hypothetical protein SAMN04488528_100934 [Clostridium frigidicarnis]